MDNKFLEKIAAKFGTFKYTNFDKVIQTLHKRAPDRSNKVAAIGALAGGGALGYAGYSQDADYVTGKKFTKPQRVKNGVVSALSGSVLGGISGKNFSSNIRSFKILNRAFKIRNKATRTSGRWGSSSREGWYNHHNAGRTVKDILKDIGAPEGGFKTKAEASKHYKRMAMKHHPDRGGDAEKMKKINKAFEEFKKHPDGFEKLASSGNIYLDTIASLGLY